MYLTPTIIPSAQAIVPTTEIEICSLLDDIDLSGLTGNLRGVSDVIDGSYDHMSRIVELIAAAKDKDKFQRSRPDQKYHNMDWWSLGEPALTLTRHHVKPRNALHTLNRTCTALPCDEARLTGHRRTYKNYQDGTSIVHEDQDFRTLRNPNFKDPKLWTGTTVYTLSPLPPGASSSSNIRSKAGPTPFAKAKVRAGKVIVPPQPARRIVSKRPPPAPVIAPRVSSRGGEQSEKQKKHLAKIDRSDIVRSDDTETSIQDRLRSLTKLDAKMLEELLRLFHTSDQMTGLERTSDYWFQRPRYWVRFVHLPRKDIPNPDREPSPIGQEDSGTFGDLLSAGRYTYVVQCSEPEKIGAEIEDRWCDMTDDQGLIVRPDEDPARDLGFDWQGFTVISSSVHGY